MAKNREGRRGFVARWFRRIWWLRKMLVLGAIAGAAFKAVKGRGGSGSGSVGSGGFGSGPGGSGRPAPLGGPFSPSMSTAATPPSAEPESDHASAAPSGAVRTLVSVPPLPRSDDNDDSDDVTESDDEGDTLVTGASLAAVADSVDPTSATVDADRAWVEPLEDGSCPESHPIKANNNSGIYHVPTGRSYKRTVAERCYASAEAAEADGYRPAKA